MRFRSGKNTGSKSALSAAALLSLGLLAGCDQLASLPTNAGATASAPGAVKNISTSVLPPRQDDRIRVASFNIQVFGITKESKQPVMAVLAETIRQFDVVGIQEIRCSDQGLMDRFVQQINSTGRAYHYVLGPRLGRSSSKEQYAFIYDTQRLAVDSRSVHTVDDPDDMLHREPLITRFTSTGMPVGQGFSFTLINMHTDPEEARDEVNVLDDVFLGTRADGRYEEDVILLGDLNVDHTRLGQLGGVPGIFCTVAGQPTNVIGTKSYDNIVFDPQHTAEFTGRSGVLDLQQAFGLTLAEAKAVSDHRPVWAEFSVYERNVIARR